MKFIGAVKYGSSLVTQGRVSVSQVLKAGGQRPPATVIISELGCGYRNRMTLMRWQAPRLWFVSVSLFVGAFAGRLVLDAQDNVAYSYPYAVQLQIYGYGAALIVLGVCALCLGQKATRSQYVGGCVTWLLLAFASGVLVLSSIPK